MGRTFAQAFPTLKRQMADLGERLRTARLRRKMTTIVFAKRMDVSRDTLNRLEKGDATIALGTYVRALRILGLDGDVASCPMATHKPRRQAFDVFLDAPEFSIRKK